MNDADYKELDKVFAENERMKKALADIVSAPNLVASQVSPYSKHGNGLIKGLQACAKIAERCLKENESNGN